MPFLTAKSLVSAPILAAIVVAFAAATRDGVPQFADETADAATPLEALADTTGESSDLPRRVMATARELDGAARVRYLRDAFEQYPQIEDDIELATLYLQSALAEGSLEDARLARDFLMANRNWHGDATEVTPSVKEPNGA